MVRRSCAFRVCVRACACLCAAFKCKVRWEMRVLGGDSDEIYNLRACADIDHYCLTRCTGWCLVALSCVFVMNP